MQYTCVFLTASLNAKTSFAILRTENKGWHNFYDPTRSKKMKPKYLWTMSWLFTEYIIHVPNWSNMIVLIIDAKCTITQLYDKCRRQFRLYSKSIENNKLVTLACTIIK